jgi:RNA polymerase sigma-70 factor (ECF subfamily)
MADPSSLSELAAAPLETESTVYLIGCAREGNRAALDVLFARYLPRLSRWAHGRLPQWARDLAETQDIVQETLLHTFLRLDHFEPRGELALQFYLRQAVANRVRDELRRIGRRPPAGALPDNVRDQAPSPLEAAIGAEACDRYEQALDRLTDAARELVVARVEMGASYEEIAGALGKRSAEAARKACERALVRLAREMGRLR